jgi:hypothetical protein
MLLCHFSLNVRLIQSHFCSAKGFVVKFKFSAFQERGNVPFLTRTQARTQLLGIAVLFCAALVFLTLVVCACACVCVSECPY